MKAIDVIRDKAVDAVVNVAGKVFSAARDKLVSLVRRETTTSNDKIIVTIYDSNACHVSKAINNAVQQKLESLATTLMTSSLIASPSVDAQSNAIANMVAESGLIIELKTWLIL